MLFELRKRRFCRSGIVVGGRKERMKEICYSIGSGAENNTNTLPYLGGSVSSEELSTEIDSSILLLLPHSSMTTNRHANNGLIYENLFLSSKRINCFYI